MAFELPNDPANDPKYTVVSSYTVNRLGTPSASVTFAEVVYVFAKQGVVESTEDRDGDGKREVLHVPALVSLGDVSGKQLALPDSTNISLVTSSSVDTTTPAVLDGQGNVVTPAVQTLTMTLTTPPATDLAGQTVGVVAVNQMGGPVYRQPSRGRKWTVALVASNPSDFARMSQDMGTILVSAVAETLNVMGIEKPTSDIVTAVQIMAAHGITIDSVWADTATQIELDRRAGVFTPSSVSGEVPNLTSASSV